MTTIPVMRRDHYDADNDGVVDESGASPLSDDNPQALGTANAGSGSSAARADHVHAMPNRARGAYDAIVYIQDGDVIAEDATGAEILSGTAGTEDSTVINAAIQSPGGKIYLATDSIKQTSSIILKSSTWLCGGGRTTVLSTNGMAETFVKATTSPLYNVQLSDFTIDGTNQTAGYGIDVSGLSSPQLWNLWVKNCYSDGIYGDSTVASPRFSNINTIMNGGNGVTLSQVYGFRFMETYHTYDGQQNLSGNACISIQGGGEGTIIGCLADGYDSINAKGTRYGIRLYAAKEVTVAGCHYLSHNNVAGIAIDGAGRNISIVGNNCKNNGLGANGAGILIVDGVNIVISGNVCCDMQVTKSQEYGIWVSGAAGPLTITGNDLLNNKTSSIYISGSVTGRIIRHNQGYITEASGTSTGTGSEQTIAHGLVAAPSKVAIVPTETGATVSAVWADGTNIYCTVTTGKAFNWSAEV
jgi:hypothetical protein